MALNKSSLLIRDYENIRQILRDVYIFGCYSREDFIEMKGISGRKYDKEQQRINAYLPKKFIGKRRVNKKVLLYCSYSVSDGANNHLADTYRNKSFTTLDITAYFFIQQLLNENDEMTVTELLEVLPIINDSIMFTKDNLRIKLDELVKRGFICTRKDGRKILYSLSEDIWRSFTDSELVNIHIFLNFIKNVSPMEMPYQFLYKKLSLYLCRERGIEVDDEDVLHFKHNHLFNSLDNDILLAILKAMKCEKLLRVESYGEAKSQMVIPIEVIHDSVYGRQYLYCLDVNVKLPKVMRLDRMRLAVVADKSLSADKKIAESLKGYSNKCWCTSGVEQNLSEIVIEFCFDEVKEQYILRRIQLEGHGGAIRKLDEGVYEYRLKLCDPDEMIPWIRSFGERARVISSGDKQTERKLVEDWRRALERYDSL